MNIDATSYLLETFMGWPRVLSRPLTRSVGSLRDSAGRCSDTLTSSTSRLQSRQNLRSRAYN